MHTLPIVFLKDIQAEVVQESMGGKKSSPAKCTFLTWHHTSNSVVVLPTTSILCFDIIVQQFVFQNRTRPANNMQLYLKELNESERCMSPLFYKLVINNLYLQPLQKELQWQKPWHYYSVDTVQWKTLYSLLVFLLSFLKTDQCDQCNSVIKETGENKWHIFTIWFVILYWLADFDKFIHIHFKLLHQSMKLKTDMFFSWLGIDI